MGESVVAFVVHMGILGIILARERRWGESVRTRTATAIKRIRFETTQIFRTSRSAKGVSWYTTVATHVSNDIGEFMHLDVCDQCSHMWLVVMQLGDMMLM